MRFEQTNAGYNEAKAWLASIHYPFEDCFSSDGYTLVATANELWEREHKDLTQEQMERLILEAKAANWWLMAIQMTVLAIGGTVLRICFKL